MTPSRLLARPLLASTFVVGAVNALKNADAVAIRAKPLADKITTLIHSTAPGVPIPTDPKTLVRINAGVQLLSGAALATGRSPRLASTVLAASLVPTTLAGHAFWEETDPKAKANQRLHFFKNASLLGGVMLASVDTEGKPGVAWRARRAARDVRKGTKHQLKAAGLEAKLAAKSVR